MTQRTEPLRVLVVDDEESIRSAVADFLDDVAGIDVVGRAADGAEAIEMVSALTPHVVLMDLRMPVMNGIEATHRITTLGPAPAVLMHSAYGDESLVLEAFQAGARGYVLKGSTASDVVTAVCNVASGQAHISDEVTRPLVAKLLEALNRERQTRVAAQEAADLLERVSAQQREFAIQAAHELRTPLTMLLGTLEMLTDVDDLDPDTARSLVRSALRAARRLRRLTEDLEVIATGDLLELRLEPVLVGGEVEAAINDLDASSKVVHDVDGVRVMADPARLRQVLHNVMSNALAVSPDGSSVRLLAEREERLVHVDVVDGGPGFEPSVLEALFEPFTQKPGAPSGLGVGLAVVRNLMSHMDGYVQASNNDAGGATVRLTFSAADR